MTERKYNLKRDPKDPRDRLCSITVGAVPLPPVVDLRETHNIQVYDQGSIGSCTANSACYVVKVSLKDESFEGSRLFLYYNTRKLENTISEDGGASLRSTMRAASMGICKELLWKYDPNNLYKQPDEQAVKESVNHKIKGYVSLIRSKYQLRACLATGSPFVFGMLLYESFESEEVMKTGIVKVPNKEKESMLGGHAMACVGYDDNRQMFIIRNSWGDKVGDKGYFYVPYDLMLDKELAFDFWKVR